LQGRAGVLDAPGFAQSVGSGDGGGDGVLDVAGPFSCRVAGAMFVMQLLLADACRR
jgi:hypothetical protein